MAVASRKYCKLSLYDRAASQIDMRYIQTPLRMSSRVSGSLVCELDDPATKIILRRCGP